MATLVNICCPPRSGSTLLDLMMGSGEEAFSCGELGGWYNLAKHRSKTGIPKHWKNFSKAIELKDVEAHEIHAAIATVLGVKFIIDSTKNKCWIYETQKWAQESCMDVYNILLWKEPVHYAHSMWKRDIYNSWYRRFVNYYSYFIDGSIDFFSLNLGDLIQNPERTLREVCTAVGMNYFYGKESFWTFEHHNIGGSPSVRKMLKSNSGSIRPIPDYPPEFEKITHDVREQCESDEKLRSVLSALESKDLLSRPVQDQVNPHNFRYDAVKKIDHKLRCPIKHGLLRIQHNTPIGRWVKFF